jgi:hypothetical protein
VIKGWAKLYITELLSRIDEEPSDVLAKFSNPRPVPSLSNREA